MKTAARSADDLADDWLNSGSLQTADVLGSSKPYPKRSELRRAEARAAGRRGADRRPAGGRPPGGAAGTHAPPAPTSSARIADPTRRPSSHQQGFAPARLPVAVSPTPAVLPIRQTSSPYRPAGIDVPVPPSDPGFDAFHRPAPNSTPMVPLAVPAGPAEPAAPPMAPRELAAPVSPALDPALWGLDIEAAPATGRRRGAEDAEQARRGRRPSPATTALPARLLGRGKSGAARLLVLALVVGAEGVAVTTMSGQARIVPQDPSTTGVSNTFALDTQVAAAPPATPSVQSSAGTGFADSLTFERAQQASSSAKVTAAVAQAKAAADRVRAAAERRDRAMRNAQRDPKAVASIMVAERGWSTGQFSCLVSLWNRESMWNYRASNSSSGAYGIPQALPGSKMASAGSDWRTNPVTQIKWGLDYIADRYGTPCGAWSHSESTGWY